MFEHGESIPYLEKLERSGRETALRDRPELGSDATELWEMYCFMGDDILTGIDVYDRRIGLPLDWEFRDCVLLVSRMISRRRELEKLKHDG